MSVHITINEFAEKGAKMGSLETNIQTALQIHAQTVLLCPVKTGQLRNSYMVKAETKEVGYNSQAGDTAPSNQKLTVRPKDAEVFVGTNSDHWFVEFGTTRQPAQPHIRPAKEIVVGGARKGEIAKKYGRDAMTKAYSKKKTRMIKKS